MTLVATLIPAQNAQPGDFKWYLGSVSTAQALLEPQSRWLVSNGVAVSRTGKFSNLFANIGILYGAGDGFTTFNLPDCRDGFSPIPMGPVSFTTLAARGGEYLHGITTLETPPHVHGYFDQLAPANVQSDSFVTWNGYQSSPYAPANITRNSSGVVGAASTPHENMPPIQVVGCMLIRY